MNDEEIRKFAALQMLSLSVVIVMMGAIGFVLLQHQAGRYETLESTMVTVGLMVLGYATSSVGVAITSGGYCRSFWQLVGLDFSPDKEGETA